MVEMSTSPFKTYFDEVAETDGDEECRAWLARVLDSKSDLVNFVGRCRQGVGVGTYAGFLKGSFNFSCRINFSDGQDVIIRFPKPGHTAFREEKVMNEVRIMDYLRQNTTLPIPHVHSWGLTRESPQQLGPFIIMDFIDGTLLSTILKQPNRPDLVLNPDIDNALLDKVYHQIAGYILQLSQLTFSQIGAISKDHNSNIWSVAARPLTYNMNELATVAGYPNDQFSTQPFNRTSDYLGPPVTNHKEFVNGAINLVAPYCSCRYFATLIGADLNTPTIYRGKADQEIEILTTVFYSPDLLLSRDDTEISGCPISNENLHAMIDAFDWEQRRVLFALHCQFNSNPPPRYYKSLVKLVFGYASQEEKDRYKKGMARSLWSLRRPEYNVATLLINHTDVSIERMQAVEEENEARRAEVSRLIEQVDDTMSACRQLIQVQANNDQKSGTVFHAAMKLLNGQPDTQSTVEWIASDGYEFASECFKDDKSLQNSLVRHWLGIEEAGADVDLSIRELKSRSSGRAVRQQLALFATIWHRARVMNSDQGLVQPAADDLLALCEDFLTSHEELNTKEFDTIFEDLLLRLYKHHDSYSAGLTSVMASFQEL
ncbi:hypothetical protein KCU88_g6020, partial [Aureobasidium melanogenum]